MHPRSPWRTLALVAVLIAPSSAQIVTNLGSIDWANPAGWSSGHVPTGGETPQISSGLVSVNSNFSVAALTLAGGTIGGGAVLTLTDFGSIWSSGSLIGTGTLRLSAGAFLDITAATSVSFSRADGSGSGGRIIENLGTITWSGAGSLLGGDGAQIINQVGGIFDLKSDAVLGYTGAGNWPGFTNNGTLRKSAGTGTSVVSQMGFTNNGAVDVLTGTLSFTAGVTSNAGTFTAASGASLLFSGGQNFNAGTTFLGPGAIRIDAGTTTISGPISSENLTFAAGTLQGTGSVSGAMAWTGGAWSGIGTLTVNNAGTLAISGAATKVFDRADGSGSGGRTIENLGTIAWSGGNLLGGDGAQILNQGTGVFAIQGDLLLGYTGGGNWPGFINAGTFRKTAGTGTATVTQTGFTNNGLVAVQAGTLSFLSGVTSNSGTFNAANGTSLLFSGGQALNPGTSFTGLGTIRIDGGTTTLNGSLSSQNLVFANGTLQGSGTLSGSMAWTGGVWSGTGTFTVNNGATLALSGSDTKFFNRADGSGSGGRIIENFGTTTFTGTGALLGGDGAQIINRATGTLLVQNDASFGYTGAGSGPILTNQGTFRKNTATGTTSLTGGSFVNTGLVDAQSGTLAFSSGVTSNAGSFNTTASSTITFVGGQAFNEGTSFTGPAGSIRIIGAATSISGNLTSTSLEFAGGDLYGSATIGGSMAWTAGTWRAADTVTFTPTSTLTLSGTADKALIRGDGSGSGGRILRTGGTLVWTDAGRIVGNDGAGIDITAGGIFELRNDSSYLFGGNGNFPFLSNAGTVKKLASAGTTTFENVAFTNTGLLQLLGGTLSLTGAAGLANNGLVEVQAGTLLSGASGMTGSGGTFNILSGGQLRYTGGTNTILNSAYNGAGLTEVAGGTLLVASSTIGGNFQLSSGTIGGSGTLTVTSGGSFNWTGGNLIHTGTLAVAAGGAMQIGSSAPKYFYRGDGSGSGGHVVTNAGTTTWTGTGSILGGDGAAFSNLLGGLFDIQGDATFGYSGSGNGPTFSNTGTLRKSAGTGTTILALPLYNDGVAESRAGILQLGGGGAGNGQFVANGGTIDFATSYTLTDGARFLGSTFSRLTAGSLVVPSLATATVGGTNAGHFSFEGGLLDGPGVFLVGQLGEVAWTGGALVSTGTLRIGTGGTLQISGAADHNFYRGDGSGSGGRTIENLGTVNWSGGNIRGGDGGQFLNAASGLIDITGGGIFGYTGGGNGPSFNNAGTLRKSGGLTTTFAQTSVTNSGLVQVNSGSLVFATGVTSNAGSFFTAPGTSLTFSGDQTFNTGTAFTGPGLMQATAGATTVSGTLNASNFVLAGGSLYGTATVNGTLTWTGGDMRGANTLSVAPGSSLLVNGTGDRAFSRADGSGSGGRVIENFGSFIVANAGNVLGGDGAQIINRAGGLLEFRNDQILGYTGAGNWPSLTNEGTLRKAVGTGTSTITNTGVTQNGLVEVATGTLQFASGVTSNGGQFSVATGAGLVFAGGQNFTTGTQILGPGLTRITGGATSLSGAVSFANLELAGGSVYGSGTLSSGLLKWTGGDLRDAATLTIGAGATLQLTGTGDRYWIRGDGSGSGGRVIENRGTMIIENSGNLLGNDGAQLINRAGATVNLRNDATIAYGGSGNGPWFTNEGTLLKSAGTGTSTIAVPFYNTGALAVTSGTLAFTSTFSSSGGGVTLANGATLSASGPIDVGTSPLAGTGTITAPAVTAGGLVSPGSSPGQLNLSGNLSLLATSTTLFELGGTTQGVTYDFLNVGGTATLNGTLQLSFVNSFQSAVLPSNTFTLLSAPTVTGTFTNVSTSGLRLFTTDGAGSFQVNYSGTALTLTNFVPVPEPSTWVLLGLGSPLLLVACRRRKAVGRG